MGCRQSFLCLLKHLLLLWRWYSLSCFSLFFIPLSFSVLCYLPFLECVFTAVPPALQSHHQLNRLAQLWLTVGLLQRWLELDGTGWNWLELAWLARTGWNWMELPEKKLELAVTGTGHPLVSRCRGFFCGPTTTKTLPCKPNTYLNVHSLPICCHSELCLWTCDLDIIQPFLQQHHSSCANSPTFLINLCQNHRRIAKESLRKVRRKWSPCFQKRQQASVGTKSYQLWTLKKNQLQPA